MALKPETKCAEFSPSEHEIEKFLEVIFEKYGYDFREYSRAHVRRRILNRLRLSGLENISLMQDKILSNLSFADVMLKDLSINVTEMFRDPQFFRTMREKVIPILKTWPYINIWHAGCSTGEEVYSMAILLQEEGLYNRSQIYATDFNHHVLNQAKEGIYAFDRMKKYAENYRLSGARGEFSDYYHAQYGSAIMDVSLKSNIIWANHNLVTDSDFAEMHLVICRNVLIYFNLS